MIAFVYVYAHLVDGVNGCAIVVEVVVVGRQSGAQLDKHVSHATVRAPALQSGLQVGLKLPAQEHQGRFTPMLQDRTCVCLSAHLLSSSSCSTGLRMTWRSVKLRMALLEASAAARGSW